MKTTAATVLTPSAASGLWVSAPGLVASRRADYSTIIKPRISLMVALAACAGYYLAPTEAKSWLSLTLAVAGIALVAWSASAFNQVLERDTDGLMRRTKDRPLPSGRLGTAEVTLLGVVCGAAGLAMLVAWGNPLTATLALTSLVLYSFVYTPLKRHTSLGTVVGAVPGAIPPVLGWTAAGGALNWEATVLFALVFLWQFPHFMAIAWIHREDYANAGLYMLPRGDSDGRVTGLLSLTYAVVLVPLSLQPAMCGLAGSVYAGVAVLVSLVYFAAAVRFALDRTHHTARRLLWASLVFLPGVFLALVFDHWRLLAI